MESLSLPVHASVVVVGGGIMGCSTLYHLAKMGVKDAILLERNRLTSGTTWHSAAQVRALRDTRNLTQMIQYSVQLYSKLEEETGQSVGWIQKGSLSIATNNDRLTHINRQNALAKAYGISSCLVSTEEAKERWPLMNDVDIIGAVWSPDDGRVSPSDVCAALIKASKKEGGKIFEHCQVTGILTKNRRIIGLETSMGVINCEAVALCAGLWSKELADTNGINVPILACEHFYLLTKPIEEIKGNLPTLSDHDHHLYLRDDSGGLLVGCFEPLGKPILPNTLNENFEFSLLPEDWEHFEPMMINALHRVPTLKQAEVKMLLNGPESFTPDGMFMLGEVAETRGLFLGCGMNSVGIASGGGAGMNLAHQIVHGHAPYDVSQADAKRFAPIFNSVEHLIARIPEVLGAHYDIAFPHRQFRSARNLQSLPLEKEHIQDKALMGQSFNWERPLFFNKTKNHKYSFARPDWFNQVGKEVMNAHKEAAVFDLSSFGKIDVCGSDSQNFLMKVCSGYLDRPTGHVTYSAVLNDRGTFESDIIVQRISHDKYRLFVGTASIKRDFAWFYRSSEDFNISLRDVSKQWAVIAIAGPKASGIMQNLNQEINQLPYFHCIESYIEEIPVIASRISYVGENGWEISCKSEHASKLYRILRENGAKPSGLYAQTSMRIEKGFLAMGHELDSDISPIEAGLLSFTRKSGGFCGYQALQKRLKKKSQTRIVLLTLNDEYAVPIGNEPIIAKDNIIGLTTSCAFGYRIGKPVALGYINKTIEQNEPLQINIAGEFFNATISPKAAFDPNGSRMRSTPL